MSRAAPLWAITCLFNPVGYRSRAGNYRRFRAALPVPLVTVELSFGAGFELGPQDADILVQISARDVLWHKERLLRIALDHVPAGCDKVVWLDSNILFGDGGWPQRLERRLDSHALVQVYSECYDLPPGVTEPGLADCRNGPTTVSIVPNLRRGETHAQVVRGFAGDGELAIRVGSGLGWGFRRELMEQCDFYAAGVMGGNDTAMVCAAFGRHEALVDSRYRSLGQREHYLQWAEPFHDAVGGAVSCLDEQIYHLWHGRLADRRYRRRHVELAAHGFDPFADIALDENGCWRWASDNRPLQRFVSEYFRERREDG